MYRRNVLTPILALLLGACSTSEVGLEPTLTPASDVAATLNALATENARLQTQVAEAAPTLTPTTPPGSITATPVPTDIPEATATQALPAVTSTATLAPPPTHALPTALPLTPIGTSASPSITLFTVSPPEIQLGDPLTLVWDASGERARIVVTDWKGRLTNATFPVPISGTLMITPTFRYSVNFVLQVFSGDAEIHATAFVQVHVPEFTPTPVIPLPSPVPGCTYAWFFPNPPAECPDERPVYSQAVAQHFEHGLMLWNQFFGSNVIYIFYEDGLSPYWEGTNDEWFPGLPESDPNLVPPPGLYQPVRGFGKLWRSDQRVRDRLGWATDQEFSIGTVAEQWHYPRYYIAGPGSVIYVIQLPDIPWFVWNGSTPGP